MKRRSVILIAVAWMLVLVGVGASALTLAVVNRQSGQAACKLVSESDYEAIERYRRLEEVRQTLLGANTTVPLDEDALVLGAIRGMMEAAGRSVYILLYHRGASAVQRRGRGRLPRRGHGGADHRRRSHRGRPGLRRLAGTAGQSANRRPHRCRGRPGRLRCSSAKTLNECVQLVQGPDGTDVQLTIQRDGVEQTVTATRAEVSVSYAEYQILDGGIGYLNIVQFTGNDVEGFTEARGGVQGRRMCAAW